MELVGGTLVMVMTELAAVSVQMIRTGPVLDEASTSSVVESESVEVPVGVGEDVIVTTLAFDDEELVEDSDSDSESESLEAVGDGDADDELALPPYEPGRASPLIGLIAWPVSWD
jgi:hypothetical protein